jgi:hypothetical protein
VTEPEINEATVSSEPEINEATVSSDVLSLPPEKPKKPKRRDLPADETKRAMVVSEAYRMRCEGEDYVAIAKALKIKGGWIEAHRIVAEHYGELVAGIDKSKMREQEAGRLMALRAAIEPDVRRGEKWAIQADLSMSTQIQELMGLGDHGGVSGGPNVQVINVVPPWADAPPSLPEPDVVIGE